ncbi:MAG: DUF3089 domain-containing protein [Parvularculaceae bacterium]
MTRIAPLILLAVLFIATVLAAGVVFQDNIVRFFIKPRTPFQISTPPPRPEYGARGAWALWPSNPETKAADVFYVHSTTYYKKRYWNGPITNYSADRGLQHAAAPNEAGPFLELGAVYGPRYRQATLYAFFTHEYDGRAARKLAYNDVRTAFEHYLKHADPTRPIILAGYGQGGLHALRLLEEYFLTDETLKARLAAAYIIGHSTPASLFEKDGLLEGFGPCAGPDDIGCALSYVDFEPGFEHEMWRKRNRALIWTRGGELESVRGKELLCVNPLSWTRTEDYVGPDHHKGAASATGLKLGDRPAPIAKAIGARCVNGILVVDRPRQEFLRRGRWIGAKWHVQPYNLFYRDLALDAERRVRLTAARMKQEARILKPIKEAVDLEDSPVNKVPNP